MKYFANVNKKPFGELTDEEQACLARACVKDKLQVLSVDEWLYCDTLCSSTDIYRTYPTSFEIQIPWDLINDNLVAFAVDMDGSAWFYTIKPLLQIGEWATPNYLYFESILKLDLDGINWKESLVMRPGHE